MRTQILNSVSLHLVPLVAWSNFTNICTANQNFKCLFWSCVLYICNKQREDNSSYDYFKFLKFGVCQFYRIGPIWYLFLCWNVYSQSLNSTIVFKQINKHFNFISCSLVDNSGESLVSNFAVVVSEIVYKWTILFHHLLLYSCLFRGKQELFQ